MATYNLSEIFQFALRIEENGEKFYRLASEKLPELKEIFLGLADSEVEHKKVFLEMMNKHVSYEPIENYPDEYFEYVKAYADRKIFTEEKMDAIVSDIKTKREAIEFAIDAEKHSIWFYSEIKSLVDLKESTIIDDIILEERKHFVQLMGMLK